MDDYQEVQVLMAGEGIAGLSAAYHMTLMGSHDYIVLEAQEGDIVFMKLSIS